MIEVENTDVNIVRNLIPMRSHMPASAYGLKAISDWFVCEWNLLKLYINLPWDMPGPHAKFEKNWCTRFGEN